MKNPEILHEIKNPLALISANIDFLSLSDTDSVHKKSYGVIKNALKRIDAVINNVNVPKPDKEEIYICRLIKGIISEYSIIGGKKNIEFDMAYSSEDIVVNFSRIKAEILFYNIYKNAVEAINERGNVSTHIAENENEVVVDIIDSGKGISEDIADRIGQPFVTTKPYGSGLGLSICRSIVAECGGTFEIMNIDGGGCLVRVTMPKEV